jgi:hypothetical protein
MAVSGYTSSRTHRLSTYKNRPQVTAIVKFQGMMHLLRLYVKSSRHRIILTERQPLLSF